MTNVSPEMSQSIRLHRQGSLLTTPIGRTTVLLDGRKCQTSFGVTDLPVRVGTHRLEVVGHDAIDVGVASGAAVDIYYAPPYTRFHRGTLGRSEHERQGWGAIVAIGVACASPSMIIVILALW
ncbi:hypothetical protein JVX90_17455 [Gordonia sp. PDNC005]|uniref:hypothetical protein n=1 Tax=unclassified Gordonia (in: high G+C Gram-positive bacteria) TaxID=2657482 RepID=UPI001963D115|nr:hypothetical protein [Gordonia sp. PDNC005]QRY62155.1 hypothetical protein JVX90_17455 [Gordonia sp. PDNC005]